MKALAPTDAELRHKYQPIRTWAALAATGATISVVRIALYDLPLIPLRIALSPLIALSEIGALYAAIILTWLAARRRFRQRTG